MVNVFGTPKAGQGWSRILRRAQLLGLPGVGRRSHDRLGLRKLNLPRRSVLHMGLGEISLIESLHCTERRIASLEGRPLACRRHLPLIELPGDVLIFMVGMPISDAFALELLLLLLELAEVAPVLVLLAKLLILDKGLLAGKFLLFIYDILVLLR